jgi:diguanylate cyclase
MLNRLKSLLRPAGDMNRRTLLWGTIIALVVGVLGLATPVDMTMRLVRQKLLTHPASGDIVVVGIDDKSLVELGDWPWNRAIHAKLVNELNRLGAKRIVFDFTLPKYVEGSGDEQLVEAMRNAKGKVFTSARRGVGKQSGARYNVMPAEPFTRYAGIASLNWKENGFGNVWKLPFVERFDSKSIRSISAVLSGIPENALDNYYVDYSVDLKSIKTFSASDIINGKTSKGVLSGKTVVIGLTSFILGDIRLVAGLGNAPGAYVHVAGAETLKRGIPLPIGWLLPLCGTLIFAAIAFFGRNQIFVRLALVCGVIMLVAAPMLLEHYLIYGEYGPALILLAIASGRRLWAKYRKKSETTNLVSMLPNLNALKDVRLNPGDMLVVARVNNYAKAVSVIASGDEEALVNEIVKRLNIGREPSTLFHADDGIFAWVQSQDSSMDLGEQLLGRRAMFNASCVVGTQSIDLSLTFGVNGLTAAAMMNRFGAALAAAADAADQGKTWIGVDDQQLTKNKWDISLVGRLHDAIDAGQVWVAYQPKMDVSSGKIYGVEALARWTDPKHGEISPEDFVGAAEAQNRMEKLTSHVLDKALIFCKLASKVDPKFTVSVNISARALNDIGIVALVCDALQRHRLKPNRLTLELTETTSIEKSPQAAATLAALRSLGVLISIDDYGTGFSSLEYLTRVPADEIKIDKQFLKHIVASVPDQKVVASTISLAHALGRTVVAEGVEDHAMLSLLESMHCDKVQGYLIGMPMLGADVIELISPDVKQKRAIKG